MPATVLFQGSELEGNVSSCKTEVTVLSGAIRESIWYVEDVGFATNNCTGETQQYQSWSLSGTSVFFMFLLGLVVFLIGLRVLFD